MKNLHILPSDKKTRLHVTSVPPKNYDPHNKDLNVDRLKWILYEKAKGSGKNIFARNVYITSYEEIKEGVDQWYLDKVLNEPYNSGGAQYSSKQDIIILTTDEELIKDGVQAIDDEFLKWFVKNPSCEFVVFNEYHQRGDISGKLYYQVIIPKEEPKQELPKLGTKEFNDLASAYFGGKPKQEHNNLNIDKLESKLDSALENETKESLTEWLESKRNKQETPNFYEQLKEYFKNTPKDKILEDWNKSSEFDNIGPTVENFIENTKQETLEEFIERHGITKQTLIDVYEDYLKNALEQFNSQREYSKEEVVKLFKKYIEDKENPITSKYKGLDSWIEQNLK